MKRRISLATFAALLAALIQLPAMGALIEMVQLDPTHWEIRANRAAADVAIGGFDIDIGYNPAALQPVLLVWGTYLGIPPSEALISASIVTPGLVNVMEVSFLDNAVLVGMQPLSFALGTLTFSILGRGDPGIEILRADVSDGFGNPIGGGPAIPEPSTYLLLGSGLALVWRFGRRR